MESKQLELPMDKTIDIKKHAQKGWQTTVKVLTNGHVQVKTLKRPPDKK